MKRGVLYLVFGIPATAILMGIITVWIAVTNPDPPVRFDGPPLTKTSYQDEP